MIAIKRLQSIMWILVVAMGALAAYLISLQVATERNAVRHMIDQIRWTRADIRYLEAEFGARGSMRQLAAWNTSDLRLYVPGPGQYLPNERALANLDRMAPVEGAFAPPPVMTAMASRPAAPVSDAAVSQEPSSSASSEFSLIRTASASEPSQAPVVKSKPRDVTPDAASTPAPARAAPVRIASVAVDKMVKPAVAQAATKPIPKADPDAGKAARLALLDQKLLGGAPLRDSKVR